MGRIPPHRRWPEIAVLQHSFGPENLKPLVVAVDGLPIAIDMALLAAGRPHDDHHRVEVACLPHIRLRQRAGHGHHLYGLLVEEKSGHVEVVNGHVAENAPRGLDIARRWRRWITAGNNHLPDITNLPG